MKKLLLLPFLLLLLCGCAHRHEYTVTTVPPTCTQNGYTKKICSCGEEEYEIIPSLGHVEFETNHIEPTCTERGLRGEILCLRCEETLSPSETLLPSGHRFSDGICSVCGHIDNSWDGAVDTSWYSEANDSFLLTSAKELAGLSLLVSEGNTFAGKYILLGNDITFNESFFTDEETPVLLFSPIGSSEAPFSGTFQGNGVTIRGLLGTNLFGYVENAVIADFTVSNSQFQGADCVGIVGEARSSYLLRIRNDGCLVLGTGRYAGGIVAKQEGGTVSECTSHGYVASDFYGVGGIAGYCSGTVYRCVSNCTVMGQDDKVGKLVGYLYYGTVFTDDPSSVGYNQNGSVLSSES